MRSQHLLPAFLPLLGGRYVRAHPAAAPQGAPPPCPTTVFLPQATLVVAPGTSDAVVKGLPNGATSTLKVGGPAITIGPNVLLLNKDLKLSLDNIIYNLNGACPALIIPVTTKVPAVGGQPEPTMPPPPPPPGGGKVTTTSSTTVAAVPPIVPVVIPPGTPNKPDPNRPDPNKPDPNKPDPNKPQPPAIPLPPIPAIPGISPVPIPNLPKPPGPGPNPPAPKPNPPAPGPNPPAPNPPGPNPPAPNPNPPAPGPNPPAPGPNPPAPKPPGPNPPGPNPPGPNPPGPNPPGPNPPGPGPNPPAPPPKPPVVPPPPPAPTDKPKECITKTVSACTQTCSFGTNSKGSTTTTSCANPSCTAKVGCTVTATTSTVTAKPKACPLRNAGIAPDFPFEIDGNGMLPKLKNPPKTGAPAPADPKPTQVPAPNPAPAPAPAPAPVPAPQPAPSAPAQLPGTGPPSPNDAPKQIYEAGSYKGGDGKRYSAIFRRNKDTKNVDVCNNSPFYSQGDLLGTFDIPASYTNCKIVVIGGKPEDRGIFCKDKPRIPCVEKPVKGSTTCLGDDRYSFEGLWVCNG